MYSWELPWAALPPLLVHYLAFDILGHLFSYTSYWEASHLPVVLLRASPHFTEGNPIALEKVVKKRTFLRLPTDLEERCRSKNSYGKLGQERTKVTWKNK